MAYIEDDDLGDAELMHGMYQVARILLVKLEKAGADPAAALRDIATRYRP